MGWIECVEPSWEVPGLGLNLSKLNFNFSRILSVLFCVKLTEFLSRNSLMLPEIVFWYIKNESESLFQAVYTSYTLPHTVEKNAGDRHAITY